MIKIRRKIDIADVFSLLFTGIAKGILKDCQKRSSNELIKIVTFHFQRHLYTIPLLHCAKIEETGTIKTKRRGGERIK